MIAKNTPRKEDRGAARIRQALGAYQAEHPRAVVEVKGRGAMIRIRVVDPGFKGLNKSERWQMVWPFVERLPSSVRDDIYLLLLFTPAEKRTSFVSREFDDSSTPIL